MEIDKIRALEELGTDEETRQHYLEAGPMTADFLNDPKLDAKMAKAKTTQQKIKIIYRYIHTKKLFGHAAFTPKEYKAEHKFKRNAGQIWEGKRMTGCTDYALVFAAIARKYGIPTTFLATAEAGFAEEVLQGKNDGMHSGHAFCECYDAEQKKWVLADPMAGLSEKEYDPKKIKLTGFHNVAGKKGFIPYARVRDIGENMYASIGGKQSEILGNDLDTIKYNQAMRDILRGLAEEKKPEITKLTKTELKEAGFKEEEVVKAEKIERARQEQELEQLMQEEDERARRIDD